MSRPSSTLALTLVTTVTAGLLVLGGALLYRPDALLEIVPELEAALADVDPRLLIVGLVLLLLVAAPTIGIAGRIRAESPTPIDPVDESAAVGVSATSSTTSARQNRHPVGRAFETQIEQATAYDDQPRWLRAEARAALVESLREIAADAYARQAGIEESAAMAAIRAGEWTDDRRAAALLADDDGLSTPLSLWLFDLVSATDPFDRSLEHTIDAIAELQSVEGLQMAAEGSA
ncbi:DUF7269 family protein [Natronosalvus vescus]|uniref:DUF7269 family protein n=1 Tax=Natronosalvus vescus TaxID=2953881 RepID=UPI002091E141|nr:hypothetical protein [Natronosalvus vescus]